jgi:tripartite-type tricarboxylate transporter receptor subunit TctC
MSKPMHCLSAFMLALSGAWPAAALAQTAAAYPSKPIRIYVGSGAGGALDSMTRLVTSKAAERTGYSFVIDNQPGAGGRIAVNKTAMATPDGYTIYSGSNNLTLNQVFKRFERDVRETLTPIVVYAVQPNMLFVTAGLPVNSVKELVAYAKANPGKLNYYSTGVGSNYHLGMVRFEAIAGIQTTHVTYKGGAQAGIDLASGRLQMMFGSSSGLAAVRAGKARLIAVATPERVPDFPDVPTMAEGGVPDFDLSSNYGAYAPIKMPAEYINLLNRELAAAGAAPDIRKKLSATGAMIPPVRTPAEIRKHWLADFDRWEDVAKKANIKAEDVN